MSTQSSMLHIRMDSKLKRKATETLSAIGLSASDAVRLLFHRIAADQAFPLELKVPNAQTQRAMAESEEMMKRAKRDSQGRARCLRNLKKPAESKRTRRRAGRTILGTSSRTGSDFRVPADMI